MALTVLNIRHGQGLLQTRSFHKGEDRLVASVPNVTVFELSAGICESWSLTRNEVVLKLERRMRTAEQVTLLRLAAQIIHIHGKQRIRIRDLESFYPKINKRVQRELCRGRKFI